MVAKKLVARISTLCQQCQSPGWGEVGNLYGLECNYCCYPIKGAVSGTILGCTSCDYRQEILNGCNFVEPAECEVFNP